MSLYCYKMRDSRILFSYLPFIIGGVRLGIVPVPVPVPVPVCPLPPIKYYKHTYQLNRKLSSAYVELFYNHKYFYLIDPFTQTFI
jgi:hypothetical protein